MLGGSLSDWAFASAVVDGLQSFDRLVMLTGKVLNPSSANMYEYKKSL